MRVINILEEGRYGGPQRRITAVAERLRDFGVDTVVVMPKVDSGVFYDNLVKAGVEVRRIMLHRLTRQTSHLIKYILFFPFEVFLLYRLLKKEGPDLVHCNSSYQFKGAIAAKLAGVPVVWHLNDTSTMRLLKMVFEKIAYYCADAFILTSRRVFDYYLKDTPLERIPSQEIQVPVNGDVFDPAKTTPDSRLSEWSGKKVLIVSNVNPIKAIGDFIEMAGKLGKEDDSICFYIAGPIYDSQASYYEKLRNLAYSTGVSQRIVFLGAVNDVPSVLEPADIFVYTSRSESGPASVWEAMAMGKAIVSTDVGAVNQYIEDGVSGFIVPVGDVQKLAHKVRLLLDDEGLRHEMGTRARHVALDRLSVETAAGLHADFYKSVCR